jgi:hypothetical protein
MSRSGERHVLLSPLTREECRQRLKARCLPGMERWAMQFRWRRPPKHLVVTAFGDDETFILAQTLPIQPRTSLFAWGDLSATPEGTRVNVQFIFSGIAVWGAAPAGLSPLSRVVWRGNLLAVGAASGVVSFVEQFRARDRAALLLRFLKETLEASEAPAG